MGTAIWWESIAASRVEEYADVIAHHAGTAYDLALAADDTELAERARAVTCRAAALAGERLQGIDTPAALRLLERALGLADEGSPQHARILLWYGAATFDERRFGRGEELLEQALSLLQLHTDPLCVEAAQFLISCKFSLGHDFAPVVTALTRAAVELPPSRAAARSFATLAMTQMIEQTQDSLRAAIATADRAVEMANIHDCGGDALAHVVRGRARLGDGDGAGMAELEAALDEVVREESGSIAIGARGGTRS